MRRVVITGAGLASPIGHDLDSVSEALQRGRHGIRVQPAWRAHPELLTQLGGSIDDLNFDKRWPRKVARTMGRVAQLATFATEAAIARAGWSEELVQDPRTGLAYGSTHGSTQEWERFALQLREPEALLKLGSAAYLKFSTHTCAANLGVSLKIRGRVLSTCAACVSASQAIGLGYEAIKYGLQDRMICGGADELHYISTGVFDMLQATSTRYGAAADESPRPFDRHRDGMVVSEGAGTLALEELSLAKARGAEILGELVGFGMSSDGTHITSPSADGMARAMRASLADAQLDPSDVDYINAHATATRVGDQQEAAATFEVFGDETPISSTKGQTGHTLGACGAIEAIFCLVMMRDRFLAGTRNLEDPDPELPPLRFLRGVEEASPRVIATHNFAFGGVNTSLILKEFR